MPSVTDFVARGKVTKVTGGTVVFAPTGTNYELHLVTGKDFPGPIGVPVEGWIKVHARKMLTVPSGGNFIAPIFGPPKTIQGRVKFVDDKNLVIHAGTNIIIELPGENSAIDLNDGQIAVGRMVNAIVFAGATFELAPAPVAK
jgi:hypothetical protein